MKKDSDTTTARGFKRGPGEKYGDSEPRGTATVVSVDAGPVLCLDLAREACPECGSADVTEWTIGWRPSDDGHSHDPNRRGCERCGHWWFVPCPRCGHEFNRHRIERENSK